MGLEGQGSTIRSTGMLLIILWARIHMVPVCGVGQLVVQENMVKVTAIIRPPDPGWPWGLKRPFSNLSSPGASLSYSIFQISYTVAWHLHRNGLSHHTCAVNWMDLKTSFWLVTNSRGIPTGSIVIYNIGQQTRSLEWMKFLRQILFLSKSAILDSLKSFPDMFVLPPTLPLAFPYAAICRRALESSIMVVLHLGRFSPSWKQGF